MIKWNFIIKGLIRERTLLTKKGMIYSITVSI